jgi:superoxide reductase
MAALLGIFKCEKCGNIVEVLHEGAGQLVCCDQPMTRFEENTTDAAVEKHVPVVEKSGDTVTVTVGSTVHPMAEDHFIEWIELFADGKVLRQQLSPGGEPVAVFDGVKAGSVCARAYCNLHGLWKS